MTGRALHDPMLHDVGGKSTGAAMISAGITLLAGLFFFRWRLLHVRFDERGSRRLLLLQFLDALVGSGQLLLEHTDLLQGLLELLFQVRNTFVCCHALSLSERSSLNSYPDFTIEKRGMPTEVIAIADVKDLRYNPEEEASLATGHMISIHRDPALRTRRQIHAVWRQFEACTAYPCILMLASGGDSLPDPLFVMAAMLGDFTISIPVPMADNGPMEITQSFGENGKMLAKDGSPMNRRISAIGLISSICPDNVYSGFTSKVDELANQFLSEDTDEEAVQKYLNACFNVKAQLTAELSAATNISA